MAQPGEGGGGEGKAANHLVLVLRCSWVETWVWRKAPEVRVWPV